VGLWDGLAGDQASGAAAQPDGGPIGGVFCASYASFLLNPRRIHSGKKDRERARRKAEKKEYGIVVCCYLVFTAPPLPLPYPARNFTCLRLWLSGLEAQRGAPPHPYPFWTV
jgi:hypothetical protein